MFSAYSSGLYDPLSKLWQTAIYYIDIARFVSIFDWGSLVAVPLTIHFGAKQTGLNFRSLQNTKPQGFTVFFLQKCFTSWHATSVKSHQKSWVYFRWCKIFWKQTLHGTNCFDISFSTCTLTKNINFDQGVQCLKNCFTSRSLRACRYFWEMCPAKETHNRRFFTERGALPQETQERPSVMSPLCIRLSFLSWWKLANKVPEMWQYIEKRFLSQIRDIKKVAFRSKSFHF